MSNFLSDLKEFLTDPGFLIPFIVVLLGFSTMLILMVVSIFI